MALETSKQLKSRNEISMDERQVETAVELSIQLTNAEATLLRAAITQAATEAESKKAAALFFGSLRNRKSHYIIRTLAGSYNAAV
jgi:hypothetical protein